MKHLVALAYALPLATIVAFSAAVATEGAPQDSNHESAARIHDAVPWQVGDARQFTATILYPRVVEGYLLAWSEDLGYLVLEGVDRSQSFVYHPSASFDVTASSK